VGGGCLSTREEVLAPVLTEGVRTRPSKNAVAAPTAHDVLYDPSMRPAAQEKQSAGSAYPKFASSARLVNALLPRMLEEEAAR
jgi:hypothetical protein